MLLRRIGRSRASTPASPARRQVQFVDSAKHLFPQNADKGLLSYPLDELSGTPALGPLQNSDITLRKMKCLS
jgi:hypothetical protein